MWQRVAILGGTGKMGRWFAGYLKNKGFDVAIHSRSPKKAAKVAQELGLKYIESLDAVRDVDAVVISTSLSSTPEVIRKVSKRMKPNTILFDIASIKRDVIEALEEARALGIRTISIHPMFGPGATSLKGKHIIVIPVGEDPELVNEVLNLFQDASTHILENAKVHDLMIALTLSLPHFINIVFGQTLKKANIVNLTKFSGTTFALQLLITEAVFSEDPELYYEIQSNNKAFAEILDDFLKMTKETIATIKKKERKTFVKSFKETKESLTKDPNFSKAYSKFYNAYEAIV